MIDEILGTKTILYLRPAYGRKYYNYSEALADWNSEKDFKIVNGPYCSYRDIEVLADIYDEIRFYIEGLGFVIHLIHKSKI